MKLTLDDCLKLYGEEGIMGLARKVQEISFKAGEEYALTKEGVKAGIDNIIKRERLAGRRDVVEYIKQENLFIYPGKLKEWGL